MGIPKDHLEKIFDPFFSTKKMGCGLGLTTAYSIIRSHNGCITVDTIPGKGSTFSIYLPAVKRVSPAKRQEIRTSPTIPCKRKILVMDDDTQIRNILERMLKVSGYRVELAQNGKEAITLYKASMESGDTFDAVILDLIIPKGIGGKQTIQRLRKIDPEVKAIVASGYSNDPVMANFKDYGFCGVMPKPFTIGTLNRTLHNVLECVN